MREWQSLAHVKWECKYHVVIVPKYRKKTLYGRVRREVGKIIRQLCRQKDVELIEGQACPDLSSWKLAERGLVVAVMVGFFRC